MFNLGADPSVADPKAVDPYVLERFAEAKAFALDVGTVLGWIEIAVNRRDRLEVPGLFDEGKITKIRDLRVVKKGTRREITAKAGAFLTRKVIRLRFDSNEAMLPTRASERFEKAQKCYANADTYTGLLAPLAERWSVRRGQRAARTMGKALSRSDAQYVPVAANLLKIYAVLASDKAVPQPNEDVKMAEAGLITYVEERLPKDSTFIADPRETISALNEQS